MATIREIFQEFGPEYMDKFANIMPKNHIKAIEAIIECRTKSCGWTAYKCTECGEIHHFFRGCGNRNCPTCQSQKGLDWMKARIEKQLPGHHFMVIFTDRKVSENL